jgi:antimicrobial peptide system SdpB family protein
MLSALTRWTTDIVERHDPFTNVYGFARSLLALATATTLMFDSTATLFRPLAGIPTTPPFCAETVQKLSPFCLAPRGHLDLVRWLAVVLLLVVASGWRPRVTGIIHWWIALGFQTTATVVDGGDQVAVVLTLLLLPITLADGRRWHWSRDSGAPRSTMQRLGRLVALSAVLAMRVQVAAIYLHAGVGKMKVTEWADGTAMYYWLKNPTFGLNPVVQPLLLPLLTNSTAVTLLTWGTIVLEVFLAMGLLATRRARAVLLVLGIALHLGIMVFMGLFSFALTMFAALILFLRPLDQEFHAVRLAELLRRARSALPMVLRAPRRSAAR